MKKALNFLCLGTGKPIIILHGLFGLLDNWLPIGKVLSEKNQVWIIDQRNHGLSPHDPSHTYEDLTNDLHHFINTHKIQKPILLGHSMGGKVAMNYALTYPEKISGLIVADIAPRAYAPQHLDIIEAIQQIHIETLQSRKEAETKIQNLISDSKIQQFILKNLTRDNHNTFQWKINIPALSNNIEHICGAINKGTPYTGPGLFLKGDQSDYILGEDTEEILTLFPNSTIKTILHAAHWLHADNPEDFLLQCSLFIAQTDQNN